MATRTKTTTAKTTTRKTTTPTSNMKHAPRAKVIRNSNIAKKVSKRYEAFKTNIADLTDLTFQVSEESLDGALYTAEKIQDLTGKAAKIGIKLVDRQLDMVFSSIETIKSKWSKDRKRISSVFSKN